MSSTNTRHRLLLFCAVSAVGASCLAFGRAFVPSLTIASGLVGLVMGAVAAFVSMRMRASGVVQLLLALTAAECASMVSALIAVRDSAAVPSSVVADAAAAPFVGWSRVLTSTLPVAGTADQLGLVAALAALATSLSIRLLDLRPGGLLPVLPSIALVAIANALGVGGPHSPVVLALPSMVAILGFIIASSLDSSGGLTFARSWRVIAASVTALLSITAALVSTSIAPLDDFREPVDPRESIDLPIDLTDVPNPLDSMTAQGSDDVMFSASVDDSWLRQPTNWRTATMDTFDGRDWSADSEFLGSGRSVPAEVPVSGTDVRVEIEIGALQPPWIPTSGSVTSVRPVGLGYDPSTGELVDESWTTGAHYELTSVVSALDADRLNNAEVPSQIDAQAMTQLPSCMPDALRELASRTAQGRSHLGEIAVGLEQALASTNDFKFNSSAVPGHTCGRLVELANEKVGTSEQFATAFVLMARSVGLPARLAVGYRPGEIRSDEHRVVVRRSDAYAWPEVALSGVGWVAFDPTPQDLSLTSPPVKPIGLERLREAELELQRDAAGPLPPTAQPEPTEADDRGSIVSLVIAALLVLTGVALFVPASSRWRRRLSRRRSADPRASVIGAWAEVVEKLQRVIPRDRPITPDDARMMTRDHFPDCVHEMSELASLVDTSVYSKVAVTSNEAARAWELSSTLVHGLRKGDRARSGQPMIG